MIAATYIAMERYISYKGLPEGCTFQTGILVLISQFHRDSNDLSDKEWVSCCLLHVLRSRSVLDIVDMIQALSHCWVLNKTKSVTMVKRL